MSIVNGIITAPIADIDPYVVGVDCPDIKIPVLLSQAGRDEQNYYVTLTVMLQR